jgi:hypothetical protein
MNYPVTCTLPREKMEFVYRVNEVLRQLQNVFAKWYNQGLSQAEYDALPLTFRSKYSYVAQIDLDTYKQFLREDFEPRSNKVIGEIGTLKDTLKNSIAWPVDIGGI